MSMNGIDISNLQGHPDTYRDQAWYRDADLVIVQGIEPPPGYPGHDFLDPETGKRGYTGVQLRDAQAAGKKVGVYVWLWNGLADTAGNIRARLDTVPPSVRLDMRPWVDVEDTTGGAGLMESIASVLGLRAGPDDRTRRQLECESRP